MAEEKIKAARIKRAEEEKINKHEMEINRIKNEKAMAAAKRQQAEQDEINAIAQRKRDKEEFLDAKKQMLIQLERDKCERKGIPFDESKFWE